MIGWSTRSARIVALGAVLLGTVGGSLAPDDVSTAAAPAAVLDPATLTQAPESADSSSTTAPPAPTTPDEPSTTAARVDDGRAVHDHGDGARHDRTGHRPGDHRGTHREHRRPGHVGRDGAAEHRCSPVDRGSADDGRGARARPRRRCHHRHAARRRPRHLRPRAASTTPTPARPTPTFAAGRSFQCGDVVVYFDVLDVSAAAAAGSSTVTLVTDFDTSFSDGGTGFTDVAATLAIDDTTYTADGNESLATDVTDNGSGALELTATVGGVDAGERIVVEYRATLGCDPADAPAGALAVTPDSLSVTDALGAIDHRCAGRAGRPRRVTHRGRHARRGVPGPRRFDGRLVGTGVDRCPGRRHAHLDTRRPVRAAGLRAVHRR